MNIFESSAWYCGRSAAENNMQRVVPNEYINYQEAWLAGYGNKPYAGVSPERFEKARIR